MRVIVSGANGFVGSSLIKKLIDNNIEILAIDVSFECSRLPNSHLVKKIECKSCDIEEIKKSIKAETYDLFYNFAWRGVNGPEKTKYDIQLDNVVLSLKFADLAKSLGCKKYLCAGTIAERAVESLDRLDRTSPGLMYAAAKYCNHLMLDTYCKNIGLNYIWMQFSNIYGPKNKTGNLISYTLGQLQKNEPADFGPANQPYDFIFIDDLVEAIYRLGIKQTSNNFYFVGSGTPMILKDYLLKIGSILNKTNLIRIGVHEDDGIRYTFEMMNNSKLIEEIGEFVTGSYDELIRYTIANF